MSVATKERPILFRGEMVNGILDGRKTQTRRVAKPPAKAVFLPGDRWKNDADEPGSAYLDDEAGRLRIECPYGKPGDRLWVREKWALVLWDGEDGVDDWVGPIPGTHPGLGWSVHYAAGSTYETDCLEDRGFRWRPSIFMPRWACRLVLEITDVRVERLNDLSEDDAIAEGFDVKTCESVLRRKAGREAMKFSRWIELPDGSEPDGDWCVDCVRGVARKQKARVCGWNDCHESDHAPSCEKCGHLLYHSLTRYGIETELDLTDEDKTRIEYTPADSRKALILAELASGMGDWSDEHAGRLAQIGFGTLWESINGVGSWEANPVVWVVSFKKEDAVA